MCLKLLFSQKAKRFMFTVGKVCVIDSSSVTQRTVINYWILPRRYHAAFQDGLIINVWLFAGDAKQIHGEDN